MKTVKAQGKDPVRRRGAARRRAVWIVTILLILAAAVGAGAWYLGGNPSSTPFSWLGGGTTGEQAEAQSYTTTVRRGDISVSAAGSAVLVAQRAVNLSFSTSGTVAELNVQNGDRVQAGQVLARLGSSQSLEASLAAAELQLLQARKDLADLQQNANLALAQAYQNLLDQQIAFEKAQAAELRSSGARCSKEKNTQYAAALDRAVQRLGNTHPEDPNAQVVIDAKNDYDTALANYQYCSAYTPLEKTSASASLAVARRSLEQAEEQYNTQKAAAGIDPTALALAEAKVKQAVTQLALAEENLAGITLVAPLDGRVTYLAAGEGAIVDTAKFMTITATDRLAVEVSLDETDLSLLTVGSAARITFDVLPDQVLNGTVVQVEPALISSGQYQVARGLVALDEDAVRVLQALPLGLNGGVEIVAREAKGVLLVPLSALRDLGDGQYAVFARDSDGALRMRMVEIGIQDRNYVEIRSGLNQGEIISSGTVQVSGAE